MSDGKVITFVLGKGGIGKTTTTLNVLAGFAIQERMHWDYKAGMPIPELSEDAEATDLGVDLDPQSNLSRGSGVWLAKEDPSVHEVLLNPQYGIDYAVKRSRIGYDLLPASPSMDNLEQELNDPGIVGRDFLLSQALRTAEGSPEYPVTEQAIKRYKRVFADTPRNLGILAIISMLTADYLIVPFQPEFFADDALDQLDARVAQVRRIKPTIEIHGVVVTMYDSRLALHKEFVKKIRARYGERVFKSMIPRSVALAEAPGFAQSIFEYAPTSTGARAYLALVKEIKERFSL